MEDQNLQQGSPTLRDLYPHLTLDELREAEQNLNPISEFKVLTALRLHSTMKVERSNQ